MYISHILTVILALDGAQSKGWWKQYDESSMVPVKVFLDPFSMLIPKLEESTDAEIVFIFVLSVFYDILKYKMDFQPFCHSNCPYIGRCT